MEYKTVRLRKGRQGKHPAGHPWIYKSQLLKSYTAIRPGTIVVVQSSDGAYLGRGYVNPRSEIAVRLLTTADEPVDGAFLERRIRDAAAKRKHLAARTDAYRAVFSEADGLPGLIVDMYAGTAVVQVATAGMEKLKPILIEMIADALDPQYIYERSDSKFRKQEGLQAVTCWHGDQGSAKVEIREGAARFLVDIEKGHKTGFYLDQRGSRMAMHTVCKGKSVLDLFCYTGAFAVQAALAGAAAVTAVDIKEDWLALGRQNAGLNGAAERITFIKSDSFKFLDATRAEGRTFDVIILDPPSFIKEKHSLITASKGYKELNMAAMKCLNDPGVLATFSCSHNMPNQIFSRILKEAAAETGRTLTIVKRCRQAEDHPIAREIPETEYLKGYFFKVVSRNT